MHFRSFLPSVIMGNVNFLPNKSDKLEILVKILVNFLLHAVVARIQMKRF